MGDDRDSILRRFRVAASAYLEVVDSAPNIEIRALLDAISRSLAELYGAALYLPEETPDTTEIAERPLAQEQWATLFRSLKEKIGSLDTYWVVFDSTLEETPVRASLAGDISEIYRDLKRDLDLEKLQISRADLLWELQASFRNHWGRHALGALKAISDLHL